MDKNCLGFFDAGILIRIAFGLRIFKDRADRAHLMGTEHFFRGGFSESFGKEKQHEHLEEKNQPLPYVDILPTAVGDHCITSLQPFLRS